MRLALFKETIRRVMSISSSGNEKIKATLLAQTDHPSSTWNNLGPSVLSPLREFKKERTLGLLCVMQTYLLVTSHEKVVDDNLKPNYRHLSCKVSALNCQT